MRVALQSTRRRFLEVAAMASGTWSAMAQSLLPSSDPPLPFLMPEDFSDLRMISWRVEQGQTELVLEPGMPWDAGAVFESGTVLYDSRDGLWKMWLISNPPSLALKPGTFSVYPYDARLTYLESVDGDRWTRPTLGLVPWNGKPGTNILLDLWSHDPSVNIDPHRGELPYEMFLFRNPSYPGAAAVIPGLPLPPGKGTHPAGLYRYRSHDGKDWHAVEGPLQLDTSDNCLVFRQPDGSYVAYHKTELPAFPGGLMPVDIADGGLRILGRRVSADGSKWSDPTQIILTPDWRDAADTQFMKLSPLAVRGGYIATVAIYHNFTQTIDLQWAGSRDGIRWWRPDRRPTVPNSPLGDYGGGMIWPAASPVMQGDRLRMYYGGLEGNHGEMFNTVMAGPRKLRTRDEAISRQSSSLPDNGALCRASWTPGRLWAMVSAAGGPNTGVATTASRALAGRRLLVNMTTRPGGELRVELLDASGAIVPGFSREDCRPLVGDHRAARVEWSNGATIPVAASRVRFYLRRTFLYGFDAREQGAS